MCEFHGSNGNGFGDIWWTDNPINFSSMNVSIMMSQVGHNVDNVTPRLLIMVEKAQFIDIVR